MSDTIRSATPMHLWIVGILATIWNCFGGYDYLMTRMENRDYLKSMMPTVDPQVTLDWVSGMPIWAQIGWGLGVWAGAGRTRCYCCCAAGSRSTLLRCHWSG